MQKIQFLALWATYTTNNTILYLSTTLLAKHTVTLYEILTSLIIAELAERSPIIIQNSKNPSSRKIWMYDRSTVQGATFNVRGQLYPGHVNATAFYSSPVVSALGSESDDRGSSPGLGKALCP